jgi:hypothetical protein
MNENEDFLAGVISVRALAMAGPEKLGELTAKLSMVADAQRALKDAKIELKYALSTLGYTEPGEEEALPQAEPEEVVEAPPAEPEPTPEPVAPDLPVADVKFPALERVEEEQTPADPPSPQTAPLDNAAEWVTVSYAARYLGVHHLKLTNAIRLKSLRSKPSKEGQLVRIADCQAFLKGADA